MGGPRRVRSLRRRASHPNGVPPVNEHALQTKAIDFIRTRYGVNVLVENRAPSAFTKTGVWDTTLVFFGLPVAIEYKHPNFYGGDLWEVLRPDQRVWGRKWIAAGGAALITADPTLFEIQDFLEMLRR